MPTGHKTAGSGRQKGTPNKVSKDIAVLAQGYGPAAIRRLALLGGLLKPTTKDTALGPQATGVAATAIKELLDRGYGKAMQPLQHGVTVGLEQVLRELAEAEKEGKPT